MLLLQNYLSHRCQYLKCCATISSPEAVLAGVPQGSVLGPLLFILFINDITQFENCYLYADDCLVVTHAPNKFSSASCMESQLVKYSNWYNNNLLVLNAAKTTIITISNSKLKLNSLPNIKFQKLNLKQADKMKYLGFFLDNQLKFNKNLVYVKRKLFPIMSNFMKNRKYINENVATIWYKGLIRPILEYCASINYTASQKIINSFLAYENRCLKIINFKQTKINTRIKNNIPSLDSRMKYLYILTFFKLSEKVVPLIDPIILPTKIESTTRLGVSGGFLLLCITLCHLKLGPYMI